MEPDGQAPGETMKRARLLCRVGELKGADFDIAGEATLGRNADNSVVLPSPSVSGQHARIVYDREAGGFFLEDLDSRNGTELDGLPVHGRERLGRLHVIRVAGLELIYQGPDLLPDRPAAAGEPTPTPGQEAPPGISLVVTSLGSLLRFPLEEGENLVGRSWRAALRIESPEISRRHAVLVVAGDQVRVRDEGSRNHTFVNGERVVGETEVVAGAQLRFGKVEAELVREGRGGSP